MLTRRLTGAACALVFAAAPSLAEDRPGIQNHAVQTLFLDEPCGAVIAQIDRPLPNLEGIGMMTMSFGFLMGYEVENPGIRGTHETVLMRLRTECAEHPESTAFDLLEQFSATR